MKKKQTEQWRRSSFGLTTIRIRFFFFFSLLQLMKITIKKKKATIPLVINYTILFYSLATDIKMQLITFTVSSGGGGR